MRPVLALLILAFATPASASGWHDYSLKIAPGFSVERMNPFLVCLAGGPDDLLIVCPLDDVPTFGPLVEYAVTKDAIITKHLGAKPYQANPSMWQGDPAKEFFFLVQREDQKVIGPLSREAWDASGLPGLSSLHWTEPRNPNFWTPVVGDLLFMGLAIVYARWPALLAIIAVCALILLRLRSRQSRAAA